MSTLNWRTGQTVANSTTIPVGPGDTIAVRNNTGTTQVVIDVVGTYDDGHLGCPCGDGATMTTSPASSTPGDGTGGSATPVRSRVARTSPPASTPAPAPPSSTSPPSHPAPTPTTAWAAGPVPATSNLNLPAGDTRANLAIVPSLPTAPSGLRNNSGTTHVVIDLIVLRRRRLAVPTRHPHPHPRHPPRRLRHHPHPRAHAHRPPAPCAAVTNLTGIFPTTATHLHHAGRRHHHPDVEPQLPPATCAPTRSSPASTPTTPPPLANASGTTNAAVDLIGYLG
ncbi:MAG: hypothetical protein R2699_16210 [Acidimicrobiales bacterium]